MPSRSVAKEFHQLLKNLEKKTHGQARIKDYCPDNFCHFIVEVNPKKGPYQHGKFLFQFNIDKSYPHWHPEVICLTDIYHPNIDTDVGDSLNICLNLFDQWSSTFGLEDIIQGLLFLFYHPNLTDPMSTYFDCDLGEEEFLTNVKMFLRGECIDGVAFAKNYGWEEYERSLGVGGETATEEEVTSCQPEPQAILAEEAAPLKKLPVTEMNEQKKVEPEKNVLLAEPPPDEAKYEEEIKDDVDGILAITEKCLVDDIPSLVPEVEVGNDDDVELATRTPVEEDELSDFEIDSPSTWMSSAEDGEESQSVRLFNCLLRGRFERESSVESLSEDSGPSVWDENSDVMSMTSSYPEDMDLDMLMPPVYVDGVVLKQNYLHMGHLFADKFFKCASLQTPAPHHKACVLAPSRFLTPSGRFVNVECLLLRKVENTWWSVEYLPKDTWLMTAIRAKNWIDALSLCHERSVGVDGSVFTEVALGMALVSVAARQIPVLVGSLSEGCYVPVSYGKMFYSMWECFLS